MRVLLALLVLAATPVAAIAQTAPPPPPPRHEGTAELAFVGTSGNATTNTLGLAASLTSRPAPWLVRQRVAFIRNEAADVVTAKSFLYGLRGERSLSARVALFSEYGFFKDRFAGIVRRHNIAAGVGWKVVDQDRGSLTIDVGAGVLDERRVAGGDVSSAAYAVGQAFKWKISSTATLEDEARVTGIFENGDDWRAIHAIALTAQLTNTFSLKASNVIRFSNVPPPGFKRTDSTTSVALVAKFARQ